MALNVPTPLLYSYIIGGDKRIIKFRIDWTGRDVIMATESFSFLIQCNFEIETPSGIAMIFGVII